MMDIQKLTKEQAVIITGFTGILCGSFGDFHADVEKRLGRGVQTFEMGMKSFMAEVKKLYEADFIEIATVCVDQAQAVPEDFVLVPKKLSDELADELANDAFNNSQSLFDHEHRDSSATQKEQFRLRWCRNKAIEYQRKYADMIEAQEQSHEK